MKRKFWRLIVAVGLSCVASGPVRADLINFSDLTAVEAPIANGYAGFNWNNFSSLNTQTDANVMPSGYAHANVDSASTTVAFNLFGQPASISRATPFSFVGAFFTAAWRDGLTIEATGSRNGVQVPGYDVTFTVSATTPTFETLNFQGIDTIQFTSSGGTPHGYAPFMLDSHPPLTQFAMDDLLVVNGAFTAGVGDDLRVASAFTASVTPEPSGFLLLALGTTLAAAWAARPQRLRRRMAPFTGE